jgi:hypothetical protein
VEEEEERGEDKDLSAILFLIPIGYNAPIFIVLDQLSL